MTSDLLVQFAHLPTLTHLEMHYFDVDYDILKNQAVPLASVRSLTIECPTAFDEKVKEDEEEEKKNKPTDGGPFAGILSKLFPNLDNLTISFDEEEKDYTLLSPDMLVKLARLEHLTELTLDWIRIDLDILESFALKSEALFPNIRVLCLGRIAYSSFAPIGAQFCRVISTLFPALTEVSFRFTHDESSTDTLYDVNSFRELAKSQFVASFDSAAFVNLKMNKFEVSID